MPKITREMRDPDTPKSVNITDQAPPPKTDPTLGITVPRPSGPRPPHRLVTIGDSLTHGFQSGAIYNTRISYPMIVAWELGWDSSMRIPVYDGFGGLPLNIEYLVRDVEHRFGAVNWLELPLAAFHIRNYMDQLEDWWERGPGSSVPNTVGIKHNLAVYGWDLRDVLARNADTCRLAIKKPKDDLLAQLIENANERAALRVLHTARGTGDKALTPLEAAQELGKDGIETLIVFVGANNALGTVVKLDVTWSTDPEYKDLEQKNKFTIWDPEHFESELALMEKEVRKINAQHVIWATVPHVTIAPLARGVGRDKVRPDSRYFPFYTRPWIGDAQFDPTDDPKITSQEARAIDSAIDQYNDAIAAVVKRGRQAGRDWYLLDVAGLLDRLACRRYYESVPARPEWWTPYELPPDLLSMKPVPDSYFFTSDANGRIRGGLFSLDGVHPTTICYGVLAQEMIRVMELAGVEFLMGDGKTVRKTPVNVNFKRLIGLDTLNSAPPQSLSSDLKWAGKIDQLGDTFTRLFRKGA